MCTNSPSLNNAKLGEEGGKGIILALATSVASRSTPANTVYKWSGVFSLFNEILTAGRAFAAAQPQTELTTTKAVPDLDKPVSTASAVNNSSKPMVVNSSFMGLTISAGYIILYFW